MIRFALADTSAVGARRRFGKALKAAKRLRRSIRAALAGYRLRRAVARERKQIRSEHMITRRAFLFGALSALGMHHADAGSMWNIRVKPPGALPIVATIPALYSTPSNFSLGQYNAPQPPFSLGLGTGLGGTGVATKIILDTSVIMQGGTGYLTDDLLQYQSGFYGRGDSAGFGVSLPTGELMLVDDTAFTMRGSGPSRKLYWVQTLGAQTLVQPIMLTLNPALARVWNGVIEGRRGSTDAVNKPKSYYQVNSLDSDYPITGIPVPPQGIPGTTVRTGPSDADILAGKMRQAAIFAGDGTFTLSTAPVSSANPSTTIASRFTIKQGNGKHVPTGTTFTSQWPEVYLAANTSGTDIVIEFIDFRGLKPSFLNGGTLTAGGYVVGGYIVRNCLFDASFVEPYLNYKTPGNVQPDNMFVLYNLRSAGDGDASHLVADNLGDLFADGARAGFISGSAGSYAMVGSPRTIYPTNPGTAGDPVWNAFGVGVSVTITAIDPNGTWVKTSANLPSSAPTGLNAIVHAPGGDPLKDSGNLLTIANIQTIQYCRINGFSKSMKFGGPCTFFQMMANYGTGVFGPQADAGGIARGFTNNAVVNSPQDICDVLGGYTGGNLLASLGIASGPHIDGIQSAGAYRTLAPYLIIDGNCIDSRKRSVDSSYFADGVLNPYFAAYGATKMQIGGLDANVYFEFGGSNFSYGPNEAKNNVCRGGSYAGSLLELSTTCIFSQTNPLTFCAPGIAAPQPNRYNSTQNASLSGYPKLVMADQYGVPATKIAFLPPPSGLSLPPGITPHTVYTIAGYGYAFFTLPAAGLSNTLQGLAVGDLLVAGMADTGLLPISGASHTIAQVKEVDGGATGGPGVPTKLRIVNPGQYQWISTTPTLVPKSGASTAGASGSASMSGAVQANILADPSGNFIDGSGSTTGTGSLNASVLASDNTGTGVTTNRLKSNVAGLSSFHDNWISDTGASPIYFSNSYQDSAGNWRTNLDTIVAYNNRWHFGAPAYATPAPDASGQSLVSPTPFYAGAYTNSPPAGTVLELSRNYTNPAPSSLTGYAVAAVTAGSVRVTFAPDPAARISPDAFPVAYGSVTYPVPAGYTPVNPSGYQYRATPASTGVPGVWKALPAISANGNGTSSATISDATLKGDTFFVECRSVNAYNSPDMVPQQAANAVGANVLMPAA